MLVVAIVVNDLALLELSEEVDLGTFTPVCLPGYSAESQSFTGRALVMGNHKMEGEMDIII